MSLFLFGLVMGAGLVLALTIPLLYSPLLKRYDTLHSAAFRLTRVIRAYTENSYTQMRGVDFYLMLQVELRELEACLREPDEKEECE